MVRTKKTARMSYGGRAPRMQLATRRANEIAASDDDIEEQNEAKLLEESEETNDSWLPDQEIDELQTSQDSDSSTVAVTECVLEKSDVPILEVVNISTEPVTKKCKIEN